MAAYALKAKTHKIPRSIRLNIADFLTHPSDEPTRTFSEGNFTLTLRNPNGDRSLIDVMLKRFSLKSTSNPAPKTLSNPRLFGDFVVAAYGALAIPLDLWPYDTPEQEGRHLPSEYLAIQANPDAHPHTEIPLPTVSGYISTKGLQRGWSLTPQGWISYDGHGNQQVERVENMPDCTDVGLNARLFKAVQRLVGKKNAPATIRLYHPPSSKHPFFLYAGVIICSVKV